MGGSSNDIVYFITVFLQLFAVILGWYYIIVSIFGWIDRKQNKQMESKDLTYALVVAAHDEEMVIEYMVQSLQQLNYASDLYDIFVIADNCTDKTARLAHEAGAQVFERFDTVSRGKGHALEWMFRKIFVMERKYDNICVFDADNVVSANFLTEINKQHNQGYRVVQGNIDSKNPYDTWISCAYSISFWSIGRLFQRARNNIGLSCQLSGTGFSVAVDVLKELGWGATCLTEDMEFTAKLVLNNEKVGWAHDALVFDEKPLTLAQSWKQRKRWMQGHADVASRFCVKLFQKGFRDKDMSALDCAVYLLQPIKAIAMGIITIMAWVQTAVPDGDFGFFQVGYLFANPLIWWALVFFEFIYIPITVCYERKYLNFKLLIGYLTYGLYSLTWIPITMQAMFGKNNKEWYHTKHIRAIDISEME